MLCEKCGTDIEHITCGNCGSIILRIGQYCYLCGKEHSEAIKATDADDGDIDFSDRVLCSDGTCIGVIDEKGVCKECGKPYIPES